MDYVQKSHGPKDYKDTKFIGQAKLLFCEIQFLSNYLPMQARERVCIVYAGAGDGAHLPALVNMFAFAEFHLYDPRGFDKGLADFAKSPNVKVRLYGDYFTDETANYIFFISDIRHLTHATKKRDGTPNVLSPQQSSQNDADILNNMRDQQRWVELMEPTQSMLKFRLIYPKLDTETFEYLDGTLYRQAWGPLSTTECRLVPTLPLVKRLWNLKFHESVMYYHNMVTRSSHFYNPIDGSSEPCSKLLDTRYDSTLSTVILRNYLIKFGASASCTQVRGLFESIVSLVLANRIFK